MTPAQRLFKRALAEKLAFIPMGAADPQQQAAGPGGQPVPQGGAGAGGPPGGPPPPGGAPMDPAMGGMPPGAPMDPSMGGMPPPPPGGAPMDPAAMGGMPPPEGMPPMDPAAMGGMPPMDPAMAGLPPEPPKEDKASLTLEDSEIVDKITQRTMDIVRQTLEMVGKAKTKDQVAAETASKSQETAAPEPQAQPGPISGMPGFDPSVIQGPLKTAAIFGKLLGK